MEFSAGRFERVSRYSYEPPRPRSPWAWGGAILLLGTLAAGLLGAAVVLWRFVDIDSVAADPPAVAEPMADVPLPPLTRTGSWRTRVYTSEPSAAFFPDSGYYTRLVGRWDALLESAGAEVSHISGAPSLDSLPAGDLLVVPAAVCLGEEERGAIHRYVMRGGDLLATWATGVRDADCEWVGYRFLQDLAEADAAGTVAKGPPTYLVVPHGSVLAAGFPPGTRVELEPEPWTTLRADASGVFWSDWALNPRAAPGGGAAGAAIARTADSGGRIAWLGSRLDVGASPRDQRLLDRLVQNAALWAAGHLLVDVEPWPDGYRAALSVTQDVEDNFRNSRRLAERFREIGVPVTFFVVTQLALENPELAEVLRSAGEVGTHGVDHRQLGGRLWSTQLAGLRQARADVAAWTGVEPVGFRPPRELYDELTLEAWALLGGRYVAGSNSARTAAPEIFHLRSGRIVVLPRVVDDDYAVMVLRGRTSPDSLRAAFQAALDKTRSLGGLDLVTLHTQLIDWDARIGAVESVVRSARESGDVWIAAAAELAEWWLRRSGVELAVREREDGSAVLSVRNTGGDPVSSVWLHVYLPEDGSTYAAPEIGETIVESEYGAWGLRVKLPALAPGGSVDILLPRRPG
jgi:peptidoglycan/xylan/chitin deacetylase (PgdA/CDA1 family)